MERAKKFTCRRKSDGEILQGISRNNQYIIGVDAWRMLNKMDCCSYPLYVYEDIRKLLADVSVLPQTKQKAYYIVPEREEIYELYGRNERVCAEKERDFRRLERRKNKESSESFRRTGYNYSKRG